MAEDTTVVGKTLEGADKPEFKAITTQDEFDRVTAGIRRSAQAKYADYDELKAKADELDALNAKFEYQSECHCSKTGVLRKGQKGRGILSLFKYKYIKILCMLL
jgi:hypothetical protein